MLKTYFELLCTSLSLVGLLARSHHLSTIRYFVLESRPWTTRNKKI